MSEQRNKRREEQNAQKNPKNVTVFIDGVRKVIPYEEYEQNFLLNEEGE